MMLKTQFTPSMSQKFALSTLCLLTTFELLFQIAFSFPGENNKTLEILYIIDSYDNHPVPRPYLKHENSYVKHRGCTKEIPAVLLYTQRFELPEGNGSSKFFVRYNVCCNGYKPYEHNRDMCVPDCGSKCDNGICKTPKNCECYPGYVKNLDDECVQVCPLGCLNGKCYSNGDCLCDYGYELDSTGKFCIPICKGGCGPNKNCTAPDHCECLKGFKMDSVGKCQFYCKRDCAHGRCIGPNICECFDGYKLRDGVCQANCSQLCRHGTCVETERCVCDKGYKYDPHTTSCLPVCKKCVNGTCIAPGCCRCFDQFKKHNRICKHERHTKFG